MSTQSNYGQQSASYADGWRSDCSWSGYASQRVVRPVEEWKGISMMRAYDPCTSWTFRRQAQIRFMNTAKAAQRAVHQFKGDLPEENGAFAAKLQLSAFHTSYPSPAHVAIGHTVFLELKSITRGLSKELADECNARALLENYECLPKALLALIKHATEALATRAVLEEASRHPELACVEYYRLFQASQASLKFPYLKDCIDAVVLFGDVLPDLDTVSLHPMTRQILDRITRRCQIFLLRLPHTEASDLRQFFGAWARDLVQALLPYLPSAKPKPEPAPKSPRPDGFDIPERRPATTEYQYGDDDGHNDPDRLPPLDAPQPPILTTEPDPADFLRNLLNPPSPADPSIGQDGGAPQPGEAASTAEDDVKKALDDLNTTGTKATEETTKYGDKREDLIERDLALKPFTEGPIEDTATEGRIVEFEMGDSTVGGQLNDRAVALSDDITKVNQLESESAVIASVLRAMLYPSEESRMSMEFIHTSGSLDPKRLAIAEICEAAYRRFPVHKEPSPNGRALLLIAADGSGSLSRLQMRMCKLLMSSWLRSASHTSVDVMAALYHSDCEQSLSGAPLVQWVHHPRKTPVFNPGEALRAVASLPDRGTGAQSDALSLKFMLDEAVQVAKGSRVYLTLISDCAWNKCFHESEKSPEEEVASVLGGFRADMGDRLHITLVALDGQNQEKVKDVVDKIVMVTGEALASPDDVARQIGQYVASCIRERRRAPKRRA